MSESGAAPVVVEEVSYFYGDDIQRRQILHEVSTEVHQGEIVILTGPSGSGKTTLITLMGALRAAQRGSVRVFGQELLDARESDMVKVRQQVGYIFQQHNLLDYLSVSQNIQLSLQLSGQKMSARERRHKIADILEQVGLDEHIDHSPRQLSGGQKQRVGIARALVTEPRLILADEPTASLDRESGRNVVQLIQDLSKKQGASVVMVTHDNRILDVADHILHLEDGRIQTISQAVASSTSRMLQLLHEHDPAAFRYIAAFALALARVASVDDVIDDREKRVIRGVLMDLGSLQESEVDLVMELALTQARLRPPPGQPGAGSEFSAEQTRNFIESLQAVASADGSVSPQEEQEIRSIARELGFPEVPGA